LLKRRPRYRGQTISESMKSTACTHLCARVWLSHHSRVHMNVENVSDCIRAIISRRLLIGNHLQTIAYRPSSSEDSVLALFMAAASHPLVFFSPCLKHYTKPLSPLIFSLHKTARRFFSLKRCTKLSKETQPNHSILILDPNCSLAMQARARKDAEEAAARKKAEEDAALERKRQEEERARAEEEMRLKAEKEEEERRAVEAKEREGAEREKERVEEEERRKAAEKEREAAAIAEAERERQAKEAGEEAIKIAREEERRRYREEMLEHGKQLLSNARDASSRGDWDAAQGALKEAEGALKVGGGGELEGEVAALASEISAGAARRDANQALDGAEAALQRGEFAAARADASRATGALEKIGGRDEGIKGRVSALVERVEKAEAEARGKIEGEKLLASARESLSEGDFAGAVSHAEACIEASGRAGEGAGGGLEEAARSVLARASAGLEREEARKRGIKEVGDAEMLLQEGDLVGAEESLNKAGALVEQGGSHGDDIKALHAVQAKLDSFKAEQHRSELDAKEREDALRRALSAMGAAGRLLSEEGEEGVERAQERLGSVKADLDRAAAPEER